MGVRHTYIKPRRLRLNGKVERSHGTDQREFYQLLTYKDDVDLHRIYSEQGTAYIMLKLKKLRSSSHIDD